MIHWNGPLNPLPNLCRQQLWHCISSQALHHPPCPLGPLDTVFFPSPPILHTVSTRESPSTILLHQDASSALTGLWLLGQQDWAERWRKEHYSSQPRPRARQHFAKPLPPPCSEEAMRAPCPGTGDSTSVAAGGEAMGFFGLKASGSHRQANWG